jgi:hypothetical protein
MPDKLKKLVRARMQKTGETYQTALRHVTAQAPTTMKTGADVVPPVKGEDGAFVYGDEHPKDGDGFFLFNGESKEGGAFVFDRTKTNTMHEAKHQTNTVLKYIHVEHGTPHGTVWRLSGDAKGALMQVPVPAGEMTPRIAEQAFADAVFPMIIETSADEGKTWVQHLDVSPRRDWPGARGLLYALLGTGRWNAGRIRARTGEELVRHPPKLLQEIADAVRGAHPGARIMLRPPMDQLIVSLPNHRTFAAAPSMRTPMQWPVYVTPVPPPRPEDGSWECLTVAEVLSTFRWPEVQPEVRIASLDEIRAK